MTIPNATAGRKLKASLFFAFARAIWHPPTEAEIMSTANIIGIEPVMAGVVPIGVNVTFKTHGGSGQRTYFYNGAQVALMILNGDDPAQYDGVQVDGSGGSVAGGSGIGGEIGSDIGELGEIAEL